MAHLLEVKNLHTSFFIPAGEVRSVSDVSFSVDRGEIVGIVGESGSGKSATASSIMQILVSPGRIVAGSIVFNGEELVGMREKDLEKIRGDKIAMIFQDPMTSLNPVFTIGHQLEEAILIHPHDPFHDLIAPEVKTLRDDALLLDKTTSVLKSAQGKNAPAEDKKRIGELIEARDRFVSLVAKDRVRLAEAKRLARASVKQQKVVARHEYLYEKSKLAALSARAFRSGWSELIGENGRYLNAVGDSRRLPEKRRQEKLADALSLAEKSHEDAWAKALFIHESVLAEPALSAERRQAAKSAIAQTNLEYRALQKEDEAKLSSAERQSALVERANLASLKKEHHAKIAQIIRKWIASVKAARLASHDGREEYKAKFAVTRYAARKKALEMLTLVGVNEPEKRLKQYPYEFSGGMLQRVMIAMALADNPDLLIADEPTTALDVTIQAQVLEVLRDIQKKLGMAIIIITHDLGVVAQICDEVEVMYAGKIIERGTTDEVFYNPQHEYTKGLLASIPSKNAHKGHRLIPIEGNPVDVFALPRGCSFAPRCRECMNVCLDVYPAEREVLAGHMTRCFASAVRAYKAGTLSKEQLVAYFAHSEPIAAGEADSLKAAGHFDVVSLLKKANIFAKKADASAETKPDEGPKEEK